MKLNSPSVCAALALAVAMSACQKSSPTRPSDAASLATSAVTDAKSGITITAPALVTPADAAKFRFAEQPLTLTIRNAAATGSGTVTYTFQVASDAGFANVVATQDNVAEGGGQTSVKLASLAGQKDYFWRARANSNGLAGPFSKGRTFNVGPQVVLQAPGVVSPANGGQSSGSQPTLTVSNAARTGPAGAITYRFEIADSGSFANILGVATVAEQPEQTSASINVKLTTNATYFWRVRAEDTGNGIQGPYSPVSSFRYVPFDLHQAIIVNSPQDLANWPEGAHITSVTFTGEAFLVDFDKRQGPGKWPEMTPPGWSGGIQYTLGMCVNKNQQQWFCSGVVQFWDGRELEASTPPSYVGRNWFYDGRWAAIIGYQPEDGETVGLWVGAGNLRDGSNLSLASCPRVCERSNVAMVTWQNSGFAQYTYSLGKTLGLVKR
jgi:hypothetical protein